MKQVNSSNFKIPKIENFLFKENAELLPTLTEVSDLQLALLEYSNLTIDRINRLAFFKSIDNVLTKHYELCLNTNIIVEKNQKKIEYYRQNKFSIGYATHGLFPYKGKYHPQMIKAILNGLNLKKGDHILDTMCGSGTTNIESSLLGIDNFAIDVSPFCKFMTKTKYDALTLKMKYLKKIRNSAEAFYTIFSQVNPINYLNNISDFEQLSINQLIVLAYFDAIGFSNRMENLNLLTAFKLVLQKYEKKLSKFIEYISKKDRNFGKLTILEDSTATDIKLPNNFIDAIVTSPPYTNVINYLRNDYPILSYFPDNLQKLKNKLIGLRGDEEEDKIKNYLIDMYNFLEESHRVLKFGKLLVMVVGFDTKQNKKYNIRKKMMKKAEEIGFKFVDNIIRKISGINNTMHFEEIIFLKKI